MNKKIIVSILVLSLSLTSYILNNKMAKKEIRVSKIEMRNLSNSNSYIGVVSSKEIVPVYVEAPVQVDSIVAKVGQEVKVGDQLMTFSPKSIIENDKELKINALDIKDTKLRITDLRDGSLKLELDNKRLEIKNLDEKIKGQKRRLPLLITEAKILKEKAETYKKLLDIDGVSSTEANKATNEADRKNVELEDLKTELDLNIQKIGLSTASFDSLKRGLEIEEAKLQSNLEKLQLNEEILKRRAEQIKKPLESPIDGIITIIDVKEGSNTFGGQRLLGISPKGESVIKVEVPIYEVNNIIPTQKAVIKNRFSGSNEVFSGVVSRVSNIASESLLGGKNDKVIEIEIRISEENNLKLGFMVDVEIGNNENIKLATIPAFSVIEENNKSYVYTVKNEKAHKIEVDIGIKTSTEYEVLNLPIGTEVIINPFKVSNGDKVKVVN